MFLITQYPKSHFIQELKLLFVLALPMAIASLAQVGSGLADTMMAGRLGADDLAAVGLGSSIFATTFITLLGIPAALSPILSQLSGAKRWDDLRYEAQQGINLSLMIGIVAAIVLVIVAKPLSNVFQLNPYTIKTLTLFLYGISLGLPATLIYRALQSYSVALNRTSAMMWICLAGLGLNIILNYALIYGHWGFPKLGGAGCGFAGAAAFWFNAIALWGYLSLSSYFKPFALNKNWALPNWKTIKEQLRLGLPVSFSFFLEVSLFSFIAIFIADFGEIYVAAQQVVLAISSVLYMIPNTLGIAVGVRVGQSLGKRNPKRAYFIAGVGISTGLIYAVMSAILLMIFRHYLLQQFTQDTMVIAIGEKILLLAAIYQLSDATQVIASGALRGYKITFQPMVIHALSFWLMGLGVGYFLAFPMGLKLYGFWIALNFALATAAIALTVYLIYIGRYYQKIHSGSLKG